MNGGIDNYYYEAFPVDGEIEIEIDIERGGGERGTKGMRERIALKGISRSRII